MNSESSIIVNQNNDNQISEHNFTFRIILKYWKKESKNTQITLSSLQCETPEKFVSAIKQKFAIKRFFCLEEIWVLQVRAPHECQIQWVKDVNGRIKLTVSDSLKARLIKRGQQSGTHDFEDPLYEIEA